MLHKSSRMLWWVAVVVAAGAGIGGCVSGRESRKEANLFPVPLGINLLNGAPGEHQRPSQQPRHIESQMDAEEIAIDYDYFMYGLQKVGASFQDMHQAQDKSKASSSSLVENLPRDTKSDAPYNSFLREIPSDTNSDASYNSFLRELPSHTESGATYNSFLREGPRDTDNAPTLQSFHHIFPVDQYKDKYTPGKPDPPNNRNTDQECHYCEPNYDQKYEDSESSDPFSVFYDSMFPEMESVVPEEATRVTTGNVYKYKHPAPSSPPAIVTKAPKGNASPSTLIPQRLPPPPFTLKNASHTVPPPRQSSFSRPYSAEKFQWHKQAMVSILERFGLSQNFTSKVFDEEERLLKVLMLIMHNHALHGSLSGELKTDIQALLSKLGVNDIVSKLNVTDIVSKIKFSELVPNFSFSDNTSNRTISDLLSNITLRDVKSEISDIVSKLKFPTILSKLKLADTASKLKIGELISSMGDTDQISMLNLTDVISKLDADQLFSKFGLTELASKLNVAGEDMSELIKLVLSLDKSLLTNFLQKVNFSKLTDLFSELKIDSTYLQGIFGRDGAAAQYSATGGDGDSKVLYLPIIDIINVSGIQSLGFLLLIVFILITAAVYTRRDPYAVRRGVHSLPGEQYVTHHDTLEWGLGNPDLMMALDAVEATTHPWDEAHISQGKPIPRPLPWNPHLASTQFLDSVHWSDTPPVHQEIHLAIPPKSRTTRPKQRLRPAQRSKPIIRQRSKLRPGTYQNIDSQGHASRLTHRQSFLQPHRPEEYDKHRHFASYEDEYEYMDDYNFREDNRPYDRPVESPDTSFAGLNTRPYRDDYDLKENSRPYDRPVEDSDTSSAGSKNKLRYSITTEAPRDEHDFYTFYRPPSLATTWRPRRTTNPQQSTTRRTTPSQHNPAAPYTTHQQVRPDGQVVPNQVHQKSTRQILEH